MTEPSTPDTAEAVETPAEGQEPTPEPTDRQEARDGRIRAERDQLRTDNEALNARVAGMQRAEIHRRAGEHLHTPSDLDLVVDADSYAECFDPDTGEVDEGAVAALLDQVITERPSWKLRTPPRLKGDGSRGGGDMGMKSTAPARPEPSHAQVFGQGRIQR